MFTTSASSYKGFPSGRRAPAPRRGGRNRSGLIIHRALTSSVGLLLLCTGLPGATDVKTSDAGATDVDPYTVQARDIGRIHRYFEKMRQKKRGIRVAKAEFACFNGYYKPMMVMCFDPIPYPCESSRNKDGRWEAKYTKQEVRPGTEFKDYVTKTLNVSEADLKNVVPKSVRDYYAHQAETIRRNLPPGPVRDAQRQYADTWYRKDENVFLIGTKAGSDSVQWELVDMGTYAQVASGRSTNASGYPNKRMGQIRFCRARSSSTPPTDGWQYTDAGDNFATPMLRPSNLTVKFDYAKRI